jgi:hypothetical protein
MASVAGAAVVVGVDGSPRSMAAVEAAAAEAAGRRRGGTPASPAADRPRAGLAELSGTLMFVDVGGSAQTSAKVNGSAASGRGDE